MPYRIGSDQTRSNRTWRRSPGHVYSGRRKIDDNWNHGWDGWVGIPNPNDEIWRLEPELNDRASQSEGCTLEISQNGELGPGRLTLEIDRGPGKADGRAIHRESSHSNLYRLEMDRWNRPTTHQFSTRPSWRSTFGFSYPRTWVYQRNGISPGTARNQMEPRWRGPILEGSTKYTSHMVRSLLASRPSLDRQKVGLLRTLPGPDYSTRIGRQEFQPVVEAGWKWKEVPEINPTTKQ